MTPAMKDAFARIERAALASERCPTVFDGLKGADTSALAKAGHVRIEVCGRNWRVVEILTGPNAGARTAENPDRSLRRPHLVIDAAGTRRNGRLVVRRSGAPVTLAPVNLREI